MNIEEYLETLAARYAPYYDVERHMVISGRPLDIVARSICTTEKYFLSTSIPLYSFDTCNISLIQAFRESVTLRHVDEFTIYIKAAVPCVVTPSPDRLSTLVNGVMVCGEGVRPDVFTAIRSFRWSKAFSFGLKGYVHLGILLVDLQGRRVVANTVGQAFRKAHLAPEWEVRSDNVSGAKTNI